MIEYKYNSNFYTGSVNIHFLENDDFSKIIDILPSPYRDKCFDSNCKFGTSCYVVWFDREYYNGIELLKTIEKYNQEIEFNHKFKSILDEEI